MASTPVTVDGAIVAFDPLILKGDPGSGGAQGATGPVGATTNLTLGTVSSVPSGQTASASLTGTAPNQVLNLVLVDGPDGSGGGGGGTKDTTAVTGILKGNGAVITAATAGTDYLTPTDLAPKAPLASPTFTGAPQLPAETVILPGVGVATGVTSHGFSTPFLPRVSRPQGPRTVVTTFQSGHGWTRQAGTSSSADDTSVYANEKQSFRITSAGDGTTNRYRPSTFGPIDMSKSALLLKIAVDNPARLTSAGVQIGITSDNFSANYSVGYVAANPVSPWVKSGNFFTLLVSRADFLGTTTGSGGLVTGTVNFASINNLQVAVVDTGAVVNVWLQEFSLVPDPPAGRIVICFDDGYLGQAQDCAPYMDKYGIAASAFIIRDLLTAADGGSTQYMSLPQAKRLHDYHGWDICPHSDTVAHHNSTNGLVDLSAADFETECIRMKNYLLQNGMSRGADIFAWPLGAYDPAHLTIAERYFTAIRTFATGSFGVWCDGYPLGDLMQMRGMAVTGGSSPDSAATVNTAIDSAMAANKTVIITFHDVKTTADGQSTTYPLTNFQTIIDHIGVTYPGLTTTLSALFKDGMHASTHTAGGSDPVTPAAIGAQPVDSDLTTIAALTATTDSFMQSKSSAWTTRTVAQVKTDLGLSGSNTGDQTTVTGNAGTATTLQTARNIDGVSFNGSTDVVLNPAINAQAASYTAVLADQTKYVTLSNASAMTFTVPPNSSVAFPVGTALIGSQIGVGQVTLTPGAAVTINGYPGLKVAAQWGSFALLKTATDTWIASGALSA